MEYIHHYKSPLGPITLASDGEALTGLWFDGQKYFGSTLGPSPTEVKELRIFTDADRWLDLYFSGKVPEFLPCLRLSGTAFQKAVWEILLTIPYGQTTTYGAIAKKITAQNGLPRMSAQAVGGAVGRNPISLMVPCHRVVGADGSLTGYAGGIEKKKALLKLERYL